METIPQTAALINYSSPMPRAFLVLCPGTAMNANSLQIDEITDCHREARPEKAIADTCLSSHLNGFGAPQLSL